MPSSETPEHRPVLYSFRRCPYAMRARMAVAASGVPVVLREILLRDKPDAMLDASPKGTVPVLVLPDKRVLDESLDVMLWALNRHDPENWLAPLHQNPRNTKSLIATNDGAFKQALDRYKYPTRYENCDPALHRGRGLDILHTLEDRLTQHPFLCGAGFSLADAAIAPFVRQFANTDRAWFDQEAGVPLLARWLDEILSSPRFTTVMDKYPLWKETGEDIPFPA